MKSISYAMDCVFICYLKFIPRSKCAKVDSILPPESSASGVQRQGKYYNLAEANHVVQGTQKKSKPTPDTCPTPIEHLPDMNPTPNRNPVQSYPRSSLVKPETLSLVVNLQCLNQPRGLYVPSLLGYYGVRLMVVSSSQTLLTGSRQWVFSPGQKSCFGSA